MTSTGTGVAVRRFTHGRVETVHLPSEDAVCTAELVFAVGQRDEALPTVGALHLLEHLVMRTVRHLPVDSNAEVDPTLTRFTATGSPGRVRQFLDGVCAALRSPDLTAMAQEARVLAAELSGDGSGPLHGARYGARGLGLVGAPGPAPADIPGEAVTELARRWFTAANALLVVDGPWPDGLELELPDAAPPVRAAEPVRSWARPHALGVPGPACAASLLLPPQEPDRLDLVAAELVDLRLAELLRHRQGLSYVVDSTILPLRDGRADLVVWAEPPEERVAEAVRGLITVVQGLARVEVTPDELDQVRERVVERCRGRSAVLTGAVLTGVAQRAGLPFHPPDPALLGEVDADRLSGYLRGVTDDVLFLLDEEQLDLAGHLDGPVTTEAPTVDTLPVGGRVFVPPLLARAVSADARKASVVLYDWGLAGAFGSEVTVLPWCDVAGVMTVAEGLAVVFGLGGQSIPVGPDLYRRGEALLAAVHRHVPATLVYAEPPEPEPGRR